jgi:antitoxin component YwqK of YwqJK toxin-antitoxin module
MLHVFGQDSINHTDADGRRNGLWRKTDKEGHKLYDGQFKNGVPSGTFRYYYSDGTLKAVSVLSEDGKIARTQSFAGNGRKIAEGNYREEKKDSTWKYYSDLDGVLISEETYLSGIKNGASKTFFPGGSVAEVIYYKDGRKEGEWIQYFEDGNLKFRGGYENDEKAGAFTVYFPSGKVNLSGAYKMGHKDGTWIVYEENGNIISSEKYSKGALIKEK